MTHATPDPVRTAKRPDVARTLRAAGEWLRLAAEALEQGEIEDAVRYARMGEFGAEGAPGRVRALRPPVQNGHLNRRDAAVTA